MVVRDQETGTPVELESAETGEGGASIVSGWDEAGSVLVRIADRPQHTKHKK